MDLPARSGPTVVMVEALKVAQRDLDAAGLGQYVIGYAVAGGSEEYPIVNVQWRGTWTGDGIDLEGDDLAQVTADVAERAARDWSNWKACTGRHARRTASGLGQPSTIAVALCGPVSRGVPRPGPLRDRGPRPPSAPRKTAAAAVADAGSVVKPSRVHEWYPVSACPRTVGGRSGCVSAQPVA
jgi:hypothetical protein